MFRDPGYYMAGMHAVWWIFWISVLAVAVFGRRSRSRGVSASPSPLLPHRLRQPNTATASTEIQKIHQTACMPAM
jgi:hypothetical protein